MYCTGNSVVRICLASGVSLRRKANRTRKTPGEFPAGCANHPLASIGFEGTKVRLNGKVVEAVDVYVGGRSGKEPQAGQRIMEAVPCDELPEVLEYLARYYPKER